MFQFALFLWLVSSCGVFGQNSTESDGGLTTEGPDPELYTTDGESSYYTTDYPEDESYHTTDYPEDESYHTTDYPDDESYYTTDYADDESYETTDYGAYPTTEDYHDYPYTTDYYECSSDDDERYGNAEFNVTDAEQTITFPENGDCYPNNAYRSWYITPPESTQASSEFHV